MELSRGGREFYDPGPTTTPALTVWEASFDGQASWKPAQLLDGRPKWLVAGPLAPTAPEGVDVAAVIATTTLPVLRAADDPELIVRDGPWIKLID